MDLGLSSFLQDLEDNKILDDTIVVLLSDHGAKYGNFFSTATGKLENLLPLNTMIIPKSFAERHPQAFLNLRENSKRLSTHHDLHFTLKHIATASIDAPYDTGNTYSRSMLDPVDHRDCEQCGIPANWCLCYQWKDIEVTQPLVDRLAAFSVESLNKFVHNGTSVCSILELKEVTSALMADFSTTTLATYRITFSVHSNFPMEFRATIIEKEGALWMDNWDIEQITSW